MKFNLFKKNKKNNNIKTSANLFLNVKDVKGNFLYTIDNKVLTGCTRKKYYKKFC